MMGYLLDTHVILWALENNSKLSRRAAQIFRDSSNIKIVSLASIWEIAIKNRIGKLPLSVNLNDIHKTLAGYGCGFVGIEQDIIAVFNTLPLLHRDPFDGILIATALNKNLTIITNDVNINKYNVPCVW